MTVTRLPIWHDRRSIPINQSSGSKRKVQSFGLVMCSSIDFISREQVSKLILCRRARGRAYSGFHIDGFVICSPGTAICGWWVCAGLQNPNESQQQLWTGVYTAKFKTHSHFTWIAKLLDICVYIPSLRVVHTASASLARLEALFT